LEVTRKTDLSLEDLLNELKKTQPGHPRSFILNEIGAICHEHEEGAEKAEETLRELLNSDSQADKLLAFCCLSVKENLDEETVVELENFKGKPENQAIISEARWTITRYRRKYQKQDN